MGHNENTSTFASTNTHNTQFQSQLLLPPLLAMNESSTIAARVKQRRGKLDAKPVGKPVGKRLGKPLVSATHKKPHMPIPRNFVLDPFPREGDGPVPVVCGPKKEPNGIVYKVGGFSRICGTRFRDAHGKEIYPRLAQFVRIDGGRANYESTYISEEDKEAIVLLDASNYCSTGNLAFLRKHGRIMGPLVGLSENATAQTKSPPS